MAFSNKTPAELRSVFGENLKTLANRYPSVSALTRALGINRTQFNRYLTGDSFPRPDVLARICEFLKVDARILLEPIEDLQFSATAPVHPYLANHLGPGFNHVPEHMFPSGFFLFSRESFTEPGHFMMGIVRVLRQDGTTFLRGYESARSMELQGLPTNSQSREYRGLVSLQESGIAVIASRRNTMTTSFNFLHSAASFENNFWVGYVTRTVPETVHGLRATRLVYEYLSGDFPDVMAQARKCGLCEFDQLPAFHKRLLRVGTPFS